MAKQSLATKYRPKSFDDLVEQGPVKKILEYQAIHGSNVNAYLFVGPAGTGKTTVARIFGNLLNKGQGSIIEIDAASNNGVDDIRRIIDEAKYQDLSSEYKVYILDEVHMLSPGAWNAFLKLLEEPPSKTVFILCTTDTRKILPTVMSRCQRHDFKNISVEGISARLEHIISEENKEGECISAIPEAIDYIARLADGCMRNAITLLDKCISYSKTIDMDCVMAALSTNDYDTMLAFLGALAAKDLPNALTASELVFQMGVDMKLFMKQFSAFLVNCIKWIAIGDLSMTTLTQAIATEVSGYSLEDLEGALRLSVKCSNDMKYEQNPIVMLQANIIGYMGGQ